MNVQVENGYTRIADELYEALMKWQLSSYEHRVLTFILRKTYGFQKKSDWISLSQFEENTGIQRSHICRALNLLLQQKIITKGGNRNKPMYSIQKNYKLWLKLPKGVRSHHKLLPKGVTIEAKNNQKQTNKLPKGVIQITKGGNSVLPKGAHTKDNITKDNITDREASQNLLGKVSSVLEFWNTTYRTAYKSAEPLLKNAEYWFGTYSLEEVQAAIGNIQHDTFWKDKMTPTMLFRRRNPRGEDVDYIGTFLNLTPPAQKEFNTGNAATPDDYVEYNEAQRKGLIW
jgi:phage replication O-like protein O